VDNSPTERECHRKQRNLRVSTRNVVENKRLICRLDPELPFTSPAYPPPRAANRCQVLSPWGGLASRGAHFNSDLESQDA
jgi:hypothetical protein